MVLSLAVHHFESVSAKVPFGIILLQDLISNKKVPLEFKCRQMVPSSGATSTSLWDTSDPEALLKWLEDNINVDCKHSVYEVQEEFAIGLADLTRQRAAEKVSAGTKDVAERTGKALGQAATSMTAGVNELDTRLKISATAKTTVDAIKDSKVAQGTAAVFTKAGTGIKSTTNKVLENERVAQATEAVGAQFKKLGASLTSMTFGRRRGGDDGLGSDVFPAEGDFAAPSPNEPFRLPEKSSSRNPTVTPAPAPVPASAAESVSEPAAKFTLEDSHP